MKNDVVWKPIRGSSQELALSCPCSEILLAGTRGSGKSDSQLMMFRKYVGIGYGRFLKGLMLDCTYKGLDDLVNRSKRWFLAFEDGAKFLSATSMYKWVWPTGEELYFRSGATEQDYMRDFHGGEFPIILHNEITKNPSQEFYDCMLSCNRSSFTPEKDSQGDKLMPPIPLQTIATTNPYGPGRSWVKRKFIDPAPYGKVVRTQTTIISPITKKPTVVEKTQVALFSSYVENIYLSPEYIAGLEREKDENKRKAWFYGSWDHSSGGAFDDLWQSSVHVVERIPIPAHWYVDRVFDWGSSTPFHIGWWAEATGEELRLPDGRVWCPARGSLILIAEWYGADLDKPGDNIGLNMEPSEICSGIKERENLMIKAGWVQGKIYPGPADNQIGNDMRSDIDSIRVTMQKNGIEWETSDKSPGSRKQGFILTRERLAASVKGEGPGIYFMRNCSATISHLPELPRDTKDVEDVLKGGEDHSYDSLRYRVLKSNNTLASKIAVHTRMG